MTLKPNPTRSRWVFSKAFQEFDVAVLAARVAEWGFDGLDLTVRPGGHVEPTNVAAGLPGAVQACRDAGVAVGMLTTNLVTPDDDTAEAICAAAAQAGVEFLKLGYVRYTPGQLTQDVEQMRRDGEAFEKLAAKHGVCLCHHVHSGPFVNANAALLAQVFRGHDPKHFGAYLDPCHLWVEGTRTGWRSGLELLGRHARLMAIKDFRHPEDTDRASAEDPMPRYVPLREGVVRWPAVLSVLESVGFKGPVSFHAEYSDVAGADALRDAVCDDLRFYDEAASSLAVAGGAA